MIEYFCKQRDTDGKELNPADHLDDLCLEKEWDATVMVDFSTKLYALLVTSTEEYAFKIVNSVTSGSGIEAYRLLRKRFESQAPGTKRALLKSIINKPAVQESK